MTHAHNTFRAITVLMVLYASGCGRSSTQITPDAIRQIKIGMTEVEVISILGTPSKVGPDPTHKGRTMEYSPDGGFNWWPRLWVHFTNDAVYSVYAKRYYLFRFNGDDEPGIYGLSNDRPAWEGTLFEESF